MPLRGATATTLCSLQVQYNGYLDEHANFRNFGTAMLTLFRCATFEAWTDVMYINKFGCDRYGYTDFQGKDMGGADYDSANKVLDRLRGRVVT